MLVFGFVVVRGVCKHYLPYRNESFTAQFSRPWWICTFQYDKSSKLSKKAPGVWWLLAVWALLKNLLQFDVKIVHEKAIRTNVIFSTPLVKYSSPWI